MQSGHSLLVLEVIHSHINTSPYPVRGTVLATGNIQKRGQGPHPQRAWETAIVLQNCLHHIRQFLSHLNLSEMHIFKNRE